jgi:hypothetical protein
MQPWFTIVTPTRDSAGWIGTTLAHYQARGITPILLLDVRTTDATAAIAKSFGVRTVPVTDFRFTEHVVRLCQDCVTTPWAYFVHDDEIPSDALLARLQQPPPNDNIQSVAIPRRWAWYEPGKPLHYGVTTHWLDRAGQNGADHHWRLFRPNAVTYISAMHTEGFLLNRWARVERHEYMVHFEWALRTRNQREAKLLRYDKARFGFGSFFKNQYLPEDQPPEVMQYAPFETNTYTPLAQAYYNARKPDIAPPRPDFFHRLRDTWHRAKDRLLPPDLNAVPKDRVGLKPLAAHEVSYW